MRDRKGTAKDIHFFNGVSNEKSGSIASFNFMSSGMGTIKCKCFGVYADAINQYKDTSVGITIKEGYPKNESGVDKMSGVKKGQTTMFVEELEIMEDIKKPQQDMPMLTPETKSEGDTDLGEEGDKEFSGGSEEGK